MRRFSLAKRDNGTIHVYLFESEIWIEKFNY